MAERPTDQQENRMKIGKKVGIVLALGFAVLSFTLVQIDLAPHRKATSELAQSTYAKSFEEHGLKMASEIDLFASCADKKPPEKSAKDAFDYRQCLLSNLPQVRTQTGVNIFGMSTILWLNSHPDDTEVRQAAFKTLDAGWADLRQSMPLYEMADSVSRAHDKSYILRAMHGSQFTTDTFNRHATDLERIELGLKHPDLANLQSKRRLSLIQ